MLNIPYQGLVAERIWRQPCNCKIAGLIPVHGHFATTFSKEFNLTMLTMFAQAAATAALRAAWDKISLLAHLICCAYSPC